MEITRDQCVSFLGNKGAGGAMIIRPCPHYTWMTVGKEEWEAATGESDTVLLGLLLSAIMLYAALLLA